MKYRVLSMILVLVLALGLLTPSARAAGGEGQWFYEETEGGLRLTEYLGTQTELTLPDTLAGKPVVEIGTGCFQKMKLTEVTIPHGIRVIGEEAFADCTALKKVHLGGSVNVIGKRAFANSGLIKIDIPGCVRVIGDEAFLGCTGLYNVVIEEGVEKRAMDIGVGFGAGSVKLHEGVETIGQRAFYGCSNLTKMFVPSTVTRIGSQAMGYTDAGKQSYQITGYAETAAERYAKDNQLTFKTLEARAEFSGICGQEVTWAFDRENGVLTLEGEGRMYDYAAAECLPWYAFREQITAAVVAEGVTSVGDFAFDGSAVAQIALPWSLKWVGSRAFADCGALEELHFPGNAPVFAADAFANTTLDGWYSGFNSTWTQEVRRDYGGSITWMASSVPHEHSYEAVLTEPTCTEGGYTTYTCVCGESYIADETDALGHDWKGTGCTRCDGKRGNPFVDVPEGIFFQDPVLWAVEKGITTGTDATHFSPDDLCQRAAVVTFLWRAAGSPEPESDRNPFVDVTAADFYYQAVLWAVEQGITNGLDDTHFGPFSYCNRAQVVTFLHRAMGNPPVENVENPFTDVPADQWFAASVLWAVKEGITNGLDDTHFGPEVICNRAQIVTFLYRAMADQI